MDEQTTQSEPHVTSAGNYSSEYAESEPDVISAGDHSCDEIRGYVVHMEHVAHMVS